MEKELRIRLLELGLRAHIATEAFRDVVGRAEPLGMGIKPSVQEANEKTLEYLAEARRLIAEDGSGKGVVPLVMQSQPHVHALEAAVGPLKKDVLDAETRAAIEAYRKLPAFTEPFDLRPGTRVVDVALHRAALERDMATDGARWRTGALLADLRDLLRIAAERSA